MILKNKGVSSLRKRLLAIAFLLLIGFLLPAVVFAADVGYVDFELLFYAHPEYEAKNKELQEAAEKLYEEARELAAELESEDEIDQLGQEYELKFQELEQEVRVLLIGFILKVVEEVAAEAQISLVLPENSIIYGGVNLTSPVIEAMYEAYGISVPSALREIMP